MTKIAKLLEKYIEAKLQDITFGDDLLNMTAKVKEDRWDYIKL